VGDNRKNSDDSRRFGPISKEQLMYKVIKWISN
jgi:type IV secretory pathway protease TraF